MTTQLIEITQIQDNPYQPRTVDDTLHIENLARSIAADGLLQAPLARNHQADGSFQLAFGHSRRKAFELLHDVYQEWGLPERYSGYSEMPIEVRELTDEEMYRYAVTENVQRKDLAPTELARSMKRYMEEFNATSKQAGDLFGMSDATVRGMVRLLELPAPVQEKLDDGTITQGTARSLMSMQKVAPESVVVETMKQIEQRQGDELPEETIERVLEHKLKDVHSMWDEDNRSGKPHSAYRGGWPLDMKRFPNQYLPELTPVDAVVALGVPDNEEACRAVTTYLDAIYRPDDFGEQEYVQEALQWNMDTLVKIDPTIQQRLEHLLKPSACNACPFYTKIRGSHFCGMKACHARKTSAWHAHLLEQASKNLGIAIYNKSVDGGYKVLDWQDEHLFAKKNKDLRLVPKGLINGYCFQSFKGVEDDVFVVAATGDALTKLKSNKQSAGVKKTDKEKATMRAMKIYRPRRRELIWEFTLVGKTIFKEVPYPMLLKIHRWEYLQRDLEPSKEVMVADNAPVDDAKIEYMRRLLVWKMAVSESWHELNNLTDFSNIVKRLEKLATEWGVKIPKTITEMAGRFQFEVDDIMGAVSAATKKAKK